MPNFKSWARPHKVWPLFKRKAAQRNQRAIANLGRPHRSQSVVLGKKGSKKKKSRGQEREVATEPSAVIAKQKRQKGGAIGRRLVRVSAASHRDFLLQALHTDNVTNLANPSPLIVRGLAVDESMWPRKILLAAICKAASSIHMPQ